MEKIKYRVIYSRIEKRRIKSESPHDVNWIDSTGKSRYSNKISQGEGWFDSFDEAKKWLISTCKYLIEHNQNCIDTFSRVITETEALVDSDIEIK